MGDTVFTSLSSLGMARVVASAQSRVCFVAPGMHDVVAEAIVERLPKLSRNNISISLDFSDVTLRMGYGTLEAVKTLRKAGLEVGASPGIRAGTLVVDDRGWFFTPTPLYLEKEPQSNETPNAICLSPDQLAGLLPRIFPPALEEALEEYPNEEREKLHAAISSEIGSQPVSERAYEEVVTAIKLAPPVKFDLARQVRVYQAYLQYVEMKLSGAAIQKHRVRIPPALQKLGATQDIEGRLRTTFDLIEKDSKLSSKGLENELSEIRKNFTPSLGKKFGRLALKAALPRLKQRVEEFRKHLSAHQKLVQQKLQEKLDESRQQVIDYYLPLAIASPPDELAGQLLIEPGEDELKQWIRDKLDSVFPTADALVSKMELDVKYKDVTFETLNEGKFLKTVREAFPKVDWDKTYKDMMAAGEEESP